MLEILLLGVVGLWAYSQGEKKVEASGDNPTAGTGQYRPSQPSQKNPWRPIVAPRVDNANQPWYGMSRDFMSGPVSVLSEDVLKNTGKIGSDVSTLWDNFKNIFGDTAKQNLQAPNIPTVQNTQNDSEIQSQNITTYGGFN